MALRSATPISGELRSINPSNGQLLRTIEMDSDARVDAKLQRAADAFPWWRDVPFSERSRLMLGAAEILERKKHNLARLMTQEMGKPLRAAVQEAEKCARACQFYAKHAAEFLADEPAETGAQQSYVRYQPLGAVLAIMPWNFPFWQLFRFAAPALMAGNVAVLKHASNVPQCALAIEDVFQRAGFPEGTFQALLIGSDRIARVLEDRRVVAVTLTGSVEAGSRVAAAAGRQIKKTVLELGGSDPFLVMPSANLDLAVSTAVQARTINNGQSCIAAKRFLIHQAVYDRFERSFVERMAALKIGDPMDESTDIGPLATADLVDKLEHQVNESVAAGARVLLGGQRLDRPGNFYTPTVLAGIPVGSPAAREELFGPVAALFRVCGIEEAIELANSVDFGLGSACWTQDRRERELFIDRIEAGVAVVNNMVVSDPRLPFGGVKRSGYGRELSVHGIREFVNIKAVSIHQVRPPAAETE